jgi:hypothetical protein
MLDKLTALQELISGEDFAEAYDKLLHDIKPKLTGLKTNENEEPFGNGVFKKPWIICTELREEFRGETNKLLSYIKAGAIYDDDTTPPTIQISYVGEYHTGDPGGWVVVVEDLESGLDAVQILIDGVVYVEETNLNGITAKTYDIPVPGIIGTHVIVVNAINNDIDWEGDQESSSTSEWVYIGPPPDEPPPIIIGST